LSLYTTKVDNKSEMWVFKGGIYVPQGKSEIRELLRDLLGKWYNHWIFGRVIEKIEPDTFVDSDEFFKTNHIDEICVKNGILNLKTLELSEYNPKKVFFSKCPVKFDLSKKCPRIEKFLKDVLRDEEDIKVFFELAGFGLYKSYFIEKACMMIGDGRNGKSKTIELLKRLVGVESCVSIPLNSLVSDSFQISELFGKMFNLAGDIGNKDLRDTSMFKSLTGRDIITGKRKFMNDIHFENYAKFVFACNELPMVYDMSRGFWSRWILMEFPYTFVTQEEYDRAEDKTNLKIRNPDIINEITSEDEMSGFLNQAILGLNRLLNNKDFSSTQGTEGIKTTWIRKSNSFMAFCIENIEESYQGKISKKQLRREYAKYCKENKLISRSDIVIKRVLTESYGATEEDERDVFTNFYDRFWVGIKWKKDKNNEKNIVSQG
ncbi:MAG: DNA primase family protein, partial [Atribacterota bacterium]